MIAIGEVVHWLKIGAIHHVLMREDSNSPLRWVTACDTAGNIGKRLNARHPRRVCRKCREALKVIRRVEG